MFSFILMILFSVYLASYGYIALFKKEWLFKLNAYVTGDKYKRHDQASSNRMRTILATAALILGVIGLVMSVIILGIYMISLNGAIEI